MTYLGALMTAYNEAVAITRRHPTGPVERRRLNRALGLLRSGHCSTRLAEYGTTAERCDCPDTRFAKAETPMCYHRLAIRLRNRALVIEAIAEAIPDAGNPRQV